MDALAGRMEALARLARALAHDVNNTLLVVRGYAELIEMRLEEGHPSRVHAQKILAEAERAAAATRELVAFSQEAPLRIGELDLGAELERMADDVRAVVGPGVAVELRTEPGSVRADPDTVRRIVLELAANARDAMPDGGRLTIEAGPEGLTVADTGTGMDEATRERAFDPMFTTKPGGEGRGLGLGVVYNLIRQQGGTVTLRSGPGEGTSVSIHLPAAKEALS